MWIKVPHRLMQVNAVRRPRGLSFAMASTPAFPTKYDLPVPRYTSYPTAPQFHAGIDAGRYRAWLGALPPDQQALSHHARRCRSATVDRAPTPALVQAL